MLGEFTVKEQVYVVKTPNKPQQEQARKIYMQTFKRARDEGSIPAEKLDDFLVEMGKWGPEKEQEVTELQEEIVKLLDPLSKGGIPLADMKERAEKASLLRMRLMQTQIEKNEYSDFTIETQAEQAKINYFINNLVYKDGEKAFPDPQSYIDGDAEVISEATKLITNWFYGANDKFFQELPENKFLIEYGFYNEDLSPVKEPEPESEFVPFLDDEGQPVVK